MRRKFIIFILILICCLPTYGQFVSFPGNAENFKKTFIDNRYRNLERSVEKLRRALSDNDFEKLSDLIFIPKEFRQKDSNFDKKNKDKELAVIGQLFKQSADEGITFDVKLQSPQAIISSNKKLFSVVPQETIIIIAVNNKIRDRNGRVVSAGKYIGKGYFLAISEDNGRSWRFLSESFEESFKREFPKAAKKVKLPKIQKPDFL